MAIVWQNDVDIHSCGMLLPEGPEEMAEAIADGLKENGCRVDQLAPQDAWEPNTYDFLMAYGPMLRMTGIIEKLGTMSRLPPLLFWFTEQVPHPRWHGTVLKVAARLRYESGRGMLTALVSSKAGRLCALGELLALQKMNCLARVFVFTESNRRTLQSLGLPVQALPMGTAPSFGDNLGLERNIDVVFLGSARDARRGQLLHNLEQDLSRRGVNFVVKDGSEQKGGAFGQERTLLLNRSKIMLNLMRQPWDDPVFRLLLAAPNKTMLLSEKVLPECYGPFRPQQHFAMADGTELAGAIQHYLKQEQERNRIADTAHDFVMNQLTMKQMTGHILEALPAQAANR